MDEWAPLPGFPGYEVSRWGQVRSPLGRILATHPSDSGYLRVKALGRNVRVHLAVLRAFVGPPPSPHHQGAHGNGNLRDNRLDNLSWKAPLDNQTDKKMHGSRPQRFSGYKPEPALVERVRELVASGESYSSTARALGLHRHSVSRIARGLRHRSDAQET